MDSILFGKKDTNVKNETAFKENLEKTYQEPEMSEAQVTALKGKMVQAKLENRRERKYNTVKKITASAAVAAVLFVVLPNTSPTIAYAMEQIPFLGQLIRVITFQEYKYESERYHADITVPEIELDALEENLESLHMELAEVQMEQVKLEAAMEEINAEIKDITQALIEEFEANLKKEEGYQDVYVKGEVLASTDKYFTLKLICYQGAGSGYAWNYYYTIDLETRERLKLQDVFAEGADYITPISENIKNQMREQMTDDEEKYYWLEDEVEEWNFKTITPDTSFYINEQDNVVIGFNEGDVAPMYMGTVEFEIPSEVLKDIRK